ncbi:MAG TPA: polyprenyl synthetase family protein [Labilithrix sp.]|nr:polyprenyl synthetase family protein [Labilithrix sp.]
MSAPEHGPSGTRARSDREGAAAAGGGPSASFARLLDTVRHHVDGQLAMWLGPKVVAAQHISGEVGAAAEAVERLALRGGKRMRAALIVAGFDACGGQGSGEAASPDDAEHIRALLRSVDRAAVAIELLQVYLLVHDDWMDDDEVRRGGPAVHVALREVLGSKRLGDTAAVLAGDLACGYAQQALLEVPLAAERVLGAARAFAQIQEDVVCGQLAEMSPMVAERARGPIPSVELIHALKTASYTVTGPLAMGAQLAGASDARVAQLAQYGRPLGIAFQLRDDLLGVFGDASATGKPVGNDIRQGKHTALIAEMHRDAAAQALLSRVLGNATASDAEVAEVVRAMERSGAKARVEARVAELLAEARAALAAMALPEASPGRTWLAGAVRALGERAS